MRINKNEKARTVAEMANFMMANADHCTRETLLLQFSQAEIDIYQAEARERANRLAAHNAHKARLASHKAA
ncbi:hypothetical protein [Rhizobium sp. CSW-27]|uniref:hypothetical protein n=1 Tax=Rhizobium sp. CSW-27 TaxID=2839985 RepID=UPI001C024960|nr:hypothetical protein [Rhizobium sp. CSW-27]MBT9373210.1 hypothetical protein [Rhizobium sp. CSW-27]